MDTGPKANGGFDLALTELLGEQHEFLVEVGTERGAALLAEVSHYPAEQRHANEAAAAVARATGNQGRHMKSDDLRDLLQANWEHPRWHDVAARCLSCGNCTMVCPTCFCTATMDENDLSGNVAERKRRWDSCFTMDHSYIHGGSVRSTGHSRYRQWMTHKLSTWVDQFGTSGCVGCGRCISWCPVGIDITEEVRAIRGGGDGDGRA
jgi:ferredoxin